MSAVGNLVENAVKYSTAGDSVQVRTRADDVAIEMMVADQGIGIPSRRHRSHLRAVLPGRQGPQPRHRRHRTRPVDRAPRRDEPRRRGARVVGGRRRLDVRPPTPASLRLPHGRPMTRSSEPTVVTRPDPRRVGQNARRTMSEATILVVEDEASFVEALTIGLRREGFEVEVAIDGPRRSTGSTTSQPDLVLLDVMLPKISGIDVCRQLRKRTPGPDHHGHRQGRRDRHGRRTRGRRRRLRHQAVPPPRAGGADARRAAPSADGRPDRGRAWPGVDPGRRRRRSIPTSTASSVNGRACRCRSRSSSCCTCCSPTPVGCCRARR